MEYFSLEMTLLLNWFLKEAKDDEWDYFSGLVPGTSIFDLDFYLKKLPNHQERCFSK